MPTGSTYLLILLILIVGIVGALLTYYGFPPIYYFAVSILALVLLAVQNFLKEYQARSEKQLSKAQMDRIENEATTKNKELEESKKGLEERQLIMKDFMKQGVVKEEDIIKSLKQESFTILHHFNRKTPKKYLEYLPDHKTTINRVIDTLGFVPVGNRAGSYFFHIVTTNSLPVALRQTSNLEAYIKQKNEESLKAIETGLKKHDPVEYREFIKSPHRKGYLIYLVGKVFATDLKIGYINFAGFDARFLPYLLRYTRKVKNVDKKKLNEVLELASISYFLSGIEPKDRDKIVSKEREIKRKLSVKILFDYETITTDTWKQTLKNYFADDKAKKYSITIHEATKRVMPIIREFT